MPGGAHGRLAEGGVDAIVVNCINIFIVVVTSSVAVERKPTALPPCRGVLK
jgi:hypothetical protein